LKDCSFINSNREYVHGTEEAEVEEDGSFSPLMQEQS
jgi:hypothetical protein